MNNLYKKMNFMKNKLMKRFFMNYKPQMEHHIILIRRHNNHNGKDLMKV